MEKTDNRLITNKPEWIYEHLTHRRKFKPGF